MYNREVEFDLSTYPRIKERIPKEKLFPEQDESPLVAHINLLFAVYSKQKINRDDWLFVKAHGINSKMEGFQALVREWNRNTVNISEIPSFLHKRTILDLVHSMVVSWGANNRHSAGNRTNMLITGLKNRLDQSFYDMFSQQGTDVSLSE